MACAAHRLIVTVKPRMRITAVIEHAIEDQAHTLFLRVVPQPQQRFVTAKLLVNVAVVLRIVFCTLGALNTGFRYSAVTPSFFRYGSFSLIPSRSPP